MKKLPIILSAFYALFSLISLQMMFRVLSTMKDAGNLIIVIVGLAALCFSLIFIICLNKKTPLANKILKITSWIAMIPTVLMDILLGVITVKLFTSPFGSDSAGAAMIAILMALAVSLFITGLISLNFRVLKIRH